MSRTFTKRRGLALLAAFSAVAAVAAYSVAGAAADGREPDGSFCSQMVPGSLFPPGLCMQVVFEGQTVQGFFGSPGEVSLRPGNYWLTVTDNSPGHNWALAGPSGIVTELTSVGAGSPTDPVTRTDKIHLKKGSYSLLCTSDIRPPSGPPTPHAPAGMRIDIEVGGVGQVG
jgi:hypothetical protein